MRIALTAALVAAGSLLTVAGCTSAAPTPAMPTAPGAQAWARLSPSERAQQLGDYNQRVQNAVASCMKGKGFSYIPYVQPGSNDPYVNYPGGYQQQRAQRAKYGFFLFAPYIYPNDPQVKLRTSTTPDAEGTDPNLAVENKLPPTQRRAYSLALEGSQPVAPAAPGAGKSPATATPSTGATTPSPQPSAVKGCQQLAQASVGTSPAPSLDADQQKLVQQLYHDRIVAALNSYAGCLKSNGYQIPSDPQQMLAAVYGTVITKLDALKKKGTIDQATARNELNSEIKASLIDIDCGKTWYGLHDEETRAMYPALG